MSVSNYDKAFETLLKDGTIHQPPYDAIFDFVSAVLKRDVSKAFYLLSQSYGVGEATLTLLSVLYSNMRQLLQVQTCESRDVAQSTGLTAWQIQCQKENVNNYTTDELIRSLRIIQKAEIGIKSGTIEEEVAVPYVLVKIM